MVYFTHRLNLKPIILSTSSDLKPFITDITMIKTATPKLMPIKEKIEMIFKKPSFFLVFKYLNATSFSNCDINLFFFAIYDFYYLINF